ncbi:MAG: hypothetical protein OQK82_00670 [Candidatus Pacearchaeota archaeon]|nr:hypothetical protein [Candidatus Pacearchaeota archaeon]
MHIKKIILYFLILLVLYSIFGCSEDKKAEIPAFVVVDFIPERIKKNIFEKDILKHKTIVRNSKKERETLEELYLLSGEDGEYVILPEQKSKNEKKLLEIFRSISYAPLFSDTKAENLINLIPEWTEITCLIPREKPKNVKARDGEGKEKNEEWYKIEAGGEIGWILSDYLLFKSFKETEAVVINEFKFLKVPIFTNANILRMCNRGFNVTLTGYEYNERFWGTDLVHIKLYDSYGWGVLENILADAHIGVILPNEVTLYKAPEDIKANAEDKLMYKKMEIVPILDLLDNDWYKVIYKIKDKAYYIKEGNEKISSKKDDITFASWVREDYFEGMDLIASIFNAKNDDPIQGVAGLLDKKAKMKRLEEIYSYIEEKKNDYPDSVFSGIGPYSLREFLQNLLIAKEDIGRAITPITTSIEDEDQPENEPGAIETGSEEDEEDEDFGEL